MTSSIVIFGGAGFLGSAIARAALSKGWRVTSVSRQGRPPTTPTTPTTITTTPPPGKGTDWHDAVEWVRGDAFDPATYSGVLETADHVAHTVGILDHRDIRSQRSPSKILDRLGSTLYDSFRELVPPTTTTKTPTTTDADQVDPLGVYDKINYEAAVAVATEVKRHANVRSFLYVSTADGFPGVPRRYVESKRRAERSLTTLLSQPSSSSESSSSELERKKEGIRTILFRPGFMYDDTGRGFTRPLARVLGLSYAANSSLGGRLGPILGAAGAKPLSVDRVGSAVVEACDDGKVSGPVEVFRIEALADMRWRAEMIV